MKNKKVHELKTIEDICRIVTEENFERLASDLIDCIGFHISLKKKLTKRDYSKLKIQSILWKDDGIMGMTSLKVNGNVIEIKRK